MSRRLVEHLVHSSGAAFGVEMHKGFADSDGREAKVYWDSDWREFVVCFFRNHGKVSLKGADYYTDDRIDAIDTARTYVRD